ncbi:MAG TPA: hypothetical protein VG796_04155 [Verrucomicrobiales bacterium]|nr:hypothetical protein [Verrucomicrobiales bacterium]
MKKSTGIMLLIVSHAGLFYAGWLCAFQNHADAIVSGNESAATGPRVMRQEEPVKSSVSTREAHRKSAVSEKPEIEFRRLASVFNGSQIKYLNDDWTVSKAAALILQLSPEEQKACDTEIARLNEALFKLQKAAFSVKERGDAKQTYRIADFSKQGDAELQKSRETFERTLGRERGEALTGSLSGHHREKFFDFGRGITEVTFEERGGKFNVLEQKMDEAGNCYQSNQFSCKELPSHYRKLFVVQ